MRTASRFDMRARRFDMRAARRFDMRTARPFRGRGSMSQRTDKVDELLRQEITSIVGRDVADPRIGFVTITSVETTRDLRHANVWVSVIGQPAERAATVAALGRAMPFVRHELGTRLRLKRIPDLHVRLDDTAERGTRVLQLLHEIEAGEPTDEVVPTLEPLPTPVARLPHEGDLPDEPAPAALPPTQSPRSRHRRPSTAARPSDGARKPRPRR